MIKFPNLKGEAGELFEVESTNYWNVELEDDATKCKNVYVIPIFADMARITHPIHGLVVELCQEEKGSHYLMRMKTFVLGKPGDAKMFWERVEGFDEVAPRNGKRLDGVERMVVVDGVERYEKDGVLRKLVEIR